MRIYDITKGQLLVLWIFGTFISIGYEMRDPLGSGIFMLSVFGILIFYTLGWRKTKKRE